MAWSMFVWRQMIMDDAAMSDANEQWKSYLLLYLQSSDNNGAIEVIYLVIAPIKAPLLE